MLPLRHVVTDGECIESIAFRYGFFPATLWEHAENAALREVRANPHVLKPGDEVYIPALEQRSERIVTGKRHRFRRRGVPARFRVVLERNGVPRANVAYTFEVAGTKREGVTGADGLVQQFIPSDAESAELRTADGDWLHFHFARLLPVTEPEGVRARLANLGFSAPERREDDPEEEVEARTARALRRFQRQHGLTVNGTADDATRAKLVAVHGS